MFHIDVIYEMRTVHYQKVFIQLIILTQNLVSFITKLRRGDEDKIAERPRESKGERASEGWGRMRHQLYNGPLENKIKFIK
jgi:hypothetical protein